MHLFFIFSIAAVPGRFSDRGAYCRPGVPPDLLIRISILEIQQYLLAFLPDRFEVFQDSAFLIAIHQQLNGVPCPVGHTVQQVGCSGYYEMHLLPMDRIIPDKVNTFIGKYPEQVGLERSLALEPAIHNVMNNRQNGIAVGAKAVFMGKAIFAAAPFDEITELLV